MKNSTNFVIWHVCIKLLAQKVFNNFLYKKTKINWYTALQMNTLVKVLIWKTIEEAHWIKDSKHYSKTNLSIWWMLGLKAEGNSNKLVPKYQ